MSGFNKSPVPEKSKPQQLPPKKVKKVVKPTSEIMEDIKQEQSKQQATQKILNLFQSVRFDDIYLDEATKKENERKERLLQLQVMNK